MVKPIKRIVEKGAACAGVLLLGAMFLPQAVGQSLRDPTKPPPSVSAGQDVAQPASSGPVLQSVLVSPGTKVAIISGQTVKLGERYGDARVVKITESEVTLSGSNGVQVLKLFPGVEKDVASSRKHPQADSRRQ